MKVFGLGVLLVLLSATASAADTYYTRLICSSSANQPVLVTFNGFMSMQARVLSRSRLLDLTVQIFVTDPETSETKKTQSYGEFRKPDVNYRPTNPRYQNLNRYSLVGFGDCVLYGVLPKEIPELKPGASVPKAWEKFTGYVQQICDAGVRTLTVSCALVN